MRWFSKATKKACREKKNHHCVVLWSVLSGWITALPRQCRRAAGFASEVPFFAGAAKQTVAAEFDRVTGAPVTAQSLSFVTGFYVRVLFMPANEADLPFEKKKRKRKKCEDSVTLFFSEGTQLSLEEQSKSSPGANYCSECDSDLNAVSQRPSKITTSNKQKATDSACVGSLRRKQSQSRSEQNAALEKW